MSTLNSGTDNGLMTCTHSGPIYYNHSEESGRSYKCLTCGQVSAQNPHAPKEGRHPFEVALEETDTELRMQPDQVASNLSTPEKRNCLKEADKIINGERQDSHGAPEDSFTIIAGYWNVFLAAKLKPHGVAVRNLMSPLDVANMMVLFKQARKLGQKPSRDNYVDSCGYEAIGADRLSE